MSKKERIFPESGVELSPFMSKHYDRVLSLATMGRYPRIIKQAIKDMEIQPDDRILDLGCGTGYNASLMAHYLGAKGRIQGIDISDEMAGQFQERFHEDNRMTFLQQRIDQPLELGRKFNKVFISFVIHGFPHEVRLRVIENALSHLEEGGSFYIFDFAEFDMNAMP
ncbi:MAG: methyltransferase domain-containing protein, partial [Bacteroidota bacterium]